MAARDFATFGPAGPNLGFQAADLLITWKGREHANLANILRRLKRDLGNAHPTPDFVIIHTGAQDIPHFSFSSMKACLHRHLEQMLQDHPGVTLIWSDIHPLSPTGGADPDGTLEYRRRRVNRAARSIMNRHGGRAISHNIGPHRPELYEEGNPRSLGADGIEILTINWRRELQRALGAPWRF